MFSWTSLRTALIVGASLCIAAPSEIIPAQSYARSGGLPAQASHYAANHVGGACGFKTYNIPNGIYRVALSDKNWYNAGNCGACMAVTGPQGNQITAMVVDVCSGCTPNFLNIDEPGYKSLVPPRFQDKINIEWHLISCAFNSPLALQLNTGVSKYWFSAQVQGSNIPVQSLDVSIDHGETWQKTVSRDYNFFDSPGAGFGNVVDVKITCFNGAVVIMHDVDVSKEKKIWADGNC